MNKIKKSALLLLLASSLLLSGCDVISAQEYEESENISTDFSSIDSGSVSEETIAATSETLTNAENGQIHKTTDENSNSSNEYLPEGISMDDLRNMVQINGKTLTMPTTLTDIMKLDDRFSYVMAFSEFLSSPEDSIDQMGVVFYDVYFDHLFVFQPCIQKEDYKKDVANCKIDSIPAGLNFKSFTLFKIVIVTLRNGILYLLTRFNERGQLLHIGNNFEIPFGRQPFQLRFNQTMLDEMPDSGLLCIFGITTA